MSESNYVENPKQRRQWTEEEDEICRKYYPSEGSSINKRLHGRTRQACRLRARFLGISSNKEVRYMRSNSWTPEEIEILKKTSLSAQAFLEQWLHSRQASICRHCPIWLCLVSTRKYRLLTRQVLFPEKMALSMISTIFLRIFKLSGINGKSSATIIFSTSKPSSPLTGFGIPCHFAITTPGLFISGQNNQRVI